MQPFGTAAAVRRFATALDNEDYSALGELLADECQYETGTATLRAPRHHRIVSRCGLLG